MGTKLVGDHHPWRPVLPLQELAHQAFGRLGNAAALHQHLQDKSVLILGTPEPMLLASDRNDNFIEVPLVAELSCRTPADFPGEGPAKLSAQSRTV